MNKLFESLAKSAIEIFCSTSSSLYCSWVTCCIGPYDTTIVALCPKILLSLLWLLNHPITCEWEMLDLTPMM
ncbi:hypothetical protein WN943_006570 [Citrus x changshan-huyou]